MRRLEKLHRRLLGLVHRRQRMRWATGWSAPAIALLWSLAAAFPIDWYFQRSLDFLQRLFLLIICVGVVIWAFRRFTSPWLRRQESELEMALLVEQQAHIDSDLVAALQFESPEAPEWGSTQLETAVIEQVAHRGEELQVTEALPRAVLSKRLKVLGVTTAVWLLLVLIFPQHLWVFLNRLLLLSMHYPTRTQIESLAINGRTIDLAELGGKPVRLTYDAAVQFEIQASGQLPEMGRVELASLDGAQEATVALEPVVKLSTDPDHRPFTGQFPRLVKPVRCQVYLGDAWTEPVKLDVAQPPVVELEPEVVPPSYAARKGSGPVRIPRGMRQFSVLEGSQVRMKVRCDRPMKTVELTLDEKPYPLVRQQPASGDVGEIWSLEAADTPLALVVQPVKYSLVAVDVDEQRPDNAIEGTIRVQPDMEPRIVATTKTPLVLPTGRPTISFRAVDDHALGRVWLTCEVIRPKASAVDESDHEVEIYKLADGATPQALLESIHSLELAALNLVKGDTVKVTLHARDFRGQREGKTASSEPLVFQVTDEQGLWASMLESDRQSARELKSMIQRELGIGGSP